MSFGQIDLRLKIAMMNLVLCLVVSLHICMVSICQLKFLRFLGAALSKLSIFKVSTLRIPVKKSLVNNNFSASNPLCSKYNLVLDPCWFLPSQNLMSFPLLEMMVIFCLGTYSRVVRSGVPRGHGSRGNHTLVRIPFLFIMLGTVGLGGFIALRWVSQCNFYLQLLRWLTYCL